MGIGIRTFAGIAAAAFAAMPGNGATADPYTLTSGNEVTTLETFRECDVCPEMIVLPLGRFAMGAPIEESEAIDRAIKRSAGITEGPFGREEEGPVHEVEIDLPIAMGRNEVTQEEWAMCVEYGGCSHAADDEIASRGKLVRLTGRMPVVNVSYNDILEYIDWLNGKVGAEVYRLPTEAEWEYAARAGATTKFAQGDELTADQANFYGTGTAQVEGRPRPDLVDRLMPVHVDELDAANAWGLRHMSGNVSERTMSCWSERHLVGLATSSAHLADARSASVCRRVGKGGNYAFAMGYSRPANRGPGRDDLRGQRFGFPALARHELIGAPTIRHGTYSAAVSCTSLTPSPPKPP